MTRCGYICCYIGLILAAAALIGGYVALNRAEKRKEGGQRKEKKRPASPEAGSAFEPGPLPYRTGDARIVTCKASADVRRAYFLSYWDKEATPEERERELKYTKHELALILAEQALAGGGIVFRQEGGELRAVMRAIVEDGGAADGRQ